VAGQEHGEGGGIVNDRDMSPAVSELTGPLTSETAPWPASVYAHEDDDLSGGPGGDQGIRTTAKLVLQLDRDQPPEEASAAPAVMAEWALWGKERDESAYRVLRCSAGTFGLDDFHGIISRYASGNKEMLPQYTVCWIPAGAADQGYLAVGIHELADADPRLSGGRPRTAGGREIEYVRLFCVRYAELAERGVRYTDLVEAVRGYQLQADGQPQPIPVTLPETAKPSSLPPFLQLAENVATLLLTTRPVCILGAEDADAEDRLHFIDLVMSLLPYGLRTTLSASTWASSTAKDLKLRLFFANAMRDDEGWTHHVTWGLPGELVFAATDDRAPLLYLNWLRASASRAEAELAGDIRPVRFSPADIRQMIATLPKDKSVEDTLGELANLLRHGDQAAVPAVVRRLRRYTTSQPDPAEREAYLQIIAKLGLLRSHPGIHPRTQASIYRVLLTLAFETLLSYRSYCRIEDAAGGPPRGALRTEMLKQLEFATYVPWLLTARAEPAFTDEQLMEGLAEQGISASTPLYELQRSAGNLRPEHRPVIYDFAMRYLITHAGDPRAELKRRGYHANTLEDVFPHDRQARRTRLEETLKLVFGEPPLRKGQIKELFESPATRPTKALEAAVKSLSPAKAAPFIDEQAASAWMRQGSRAAGVQVIEPGWQRRFRRPGRRRLAAAPHTIAAAQKKAVYGGLGIIALLAGAILILVLASAHV
jgi:hypothetical protein